MLAQCRNDCALIISSLSRFQPDFRSAIDKLYIDFNVWTVGEYKSVVEDIERRCQSDDAKRKRKSSKSCRPGRRQNIQLAIEAMAAMQEMEKQQAQQPSQ